MRAASHLLAGTGVGRRMLRRNRGFEGCVSIPAAAIMAPSWHVMQLGTGDSVAIE